MPVTVGPVAINPGTVVTVVGRQLEPWLQTKTVQVAEVARATGPVDTGLLVSRITSGVTGSLSGLVGRVTASTGYARFVHEGTRPHLITVKSARVLRFTSNGHVLFRSHVNHPGTRPNPFLREALRSVIGR